jgi:ADP-ribosylglycohydrolase
MAWNDAAASHTKNGIYGAMWVSACIAAACVEDDVEQVLLRGLEQVPRQSRFTEHILKTIKAATVNDRDFEKTFDDIDRRLSAYHCVHTINNACICAAALIHAKGSFSDAITIAVMGGLDTDCNGATVGSIAGVMAGITAIDEKWTTCFNGRLKTALAGFGEVRIPELIEQTMALIKKRITLSR